MKLRICIPGKSFGIDFLKSYTNMLATLRKYDVEVRVHFNYNPNLYLVRNLCLGGTPAGGVDQKPFGGEEYDYILFIDSDMVFSGEDVVELISTADKDNHNILAGLYKMAGPSRPYTVIEDYAECWDEEAKAFRYMTAERLAELENDGAKTLPVDIAGTGFMCIKQGVLEKMSYPWFAPAIGELVDVVDVLGDDVNFCLEAAKVGFGVAVVPSIKLGHVKEFIIN